MSTKSARGLIRPAANGTACRQGKARRLRGTLVAALASALAVLAAAPKAEAKRTGMNLACHNCHEGPNHPEVHAELSANRVEAGQSILVTVTAKHPSAKVGGVLVDSMGLGVLELVDPVGTHLFENTPTQATHAMPQVYMNGQVQFSFRWVAPAAMQGVANFDIWSNAGNDNLMPQDDASDETTASVSVGCDAVWYYLDGDGDGFGEQKGRVYSCEPVVGRITVGGDCNDKSAVVKPDAAEACNSIDDNCDGVTDEGFTPILLFSDADGDGFGSKSGATAIGCPPLPGFASNWDDCADNNYAVNPGVAEVANGLDDNCDGKRDETTTAPIGGTGGGPGPTGPESSGCALGPRPGGSAMDFVAPLVLLGWARRRRATRRA